MNAEHLEDTLRALWIVEDLHHEDYVERVSFLPGRGYRLLLRIKARLAQKAYPPERTRSNTTTPDR